MQKRMPQSTTFFDGGALNLPLECVACGGGWVVVLQHALKLALGTPAGFYLCWAWRYPDKAKLRTKAGCC